MGQDEQLFLAGASVIKPTYRWYGVPRGQRKQRELFGACPVADASGNSASITEDAGIVATKPLDALPLRSCGLGTTLRVRVVGLNQADIRLEVHRGHEQTFVEAKAFDKQGREFDGQLVCDMTAWLKGVATDMPGMCEVNVSRETSMNAVVADEICITIAGRSLCEKLFQHG